ncbi:MAG: peptidylprolyl isomerase [Candidatus Cloacimonetes bacterium]|nr:peptidylprolyl isomerase [Candidatus Cloacimonadota bacterium]
MFEQMRRNAKAIFWVVAIVFIVSMGIGGIAGIFTPQPFLAKIADQKITYTQYKDMLQRAYGKYAEENPDKEIDDAAMTQINNDTFKQLKDEILLAEQITKYKIKVTDNDILEKFHNPGDDIKQIPDFQTDGVFDNQKYEDALMNNDQFAQYLEANYRNSLPYEKLYSRIKSEVVVSMDDVKDDYIKKNNKADARVIFFDPKKVENVEATDEELQVYYDEHKEDYKRDPARKYKYVKITLEASEADINTAKNRIDEVSKQVTLGNFAELAEEYSEDTSAADGGDLGWFGHGKMVKEFDEMVFKMGVNTISKPLKSQFGWHIIYKRETRKTEAGDDEVLASHILIKAEPSQETKDKLSFVAYDLFDLSEKVGIDSAAASMKYEAKETREFFADATFISGIGKDPALVEFAFKNKVGKMPDPVLQQDGGYIVAQISYKVGEHYQDFEEVKARIKRTVETEKKTAIVTARADSFAAAYPPAEYLEKAEAAGWEIVDAKEVTIDKSLPKVRLVEALNEAILALEPEQYTGLIKNDNGAYIAYVTARTNPDMAKFEEEKESLLNTLQESKENEHLNEWYRDMIDKAEVIDNRHIYFPNI